jgi:hypothetical protein
MFNFPLTRDHRTRKIQYLGKWQIRKHAEGIVTPEPCPS